MIILQNDYRPPPGGVHKVEHNLIISAARKARYRDNMSQRVNYRLKTTFRETKWLIFKFKVSHLEIICHKVGGFKNDYSNLWNIAHDCGFISEHERDVLNLKALDSSKVEAMLLSKENYLSTAEMMKLKETLKIKEI
ncbi:hypothetical protein ACTOJ1_000883 [Shigella flexneri]